MPESFSKTTISREKRTLKDRVDFLVIIEQIFMPIIVDIVTKNKESAQILKKLDLWFLIFTYSHLMIQLLDHIPVTNRMICDM